MKTYAYGFPRLGKNREYKKALESYWGGKTHAVDLRRSLVRIEGERSEAYSRVDFAPQGETSLYDPVADAAFMFGVEPWTGEAGYYDFCRGPRAAAMTKYFNTNYHYLRPRIASPRFSFSWDKFEYLDLKNPALLGLVGPFTFLKLAELLVPLSDCVAPLADAYAALFKSYPEALFQLDEPAFILDLDREETDAALALYRRLEKHLSRIICLTYYDSVDAIGLFELGFRAWGLDFVHGTRNLANLSRLAGGTTLIAGLIDGRNVFPKDEAAVARTLKDVRAAFSGEIWISNAAPLSHLPYTTQNERRPEIREHFRFALEKLDEIAGYESVDPDSVLAAAGDSADKSEPFSLPDAARASYEERQRRQSDLGLPLFPTTTIGSFPQSDEVRKARNLLHKGETSAEDFRSFIRDKIGEVIRYQEERGFDVLVHGEFERTDMVEFFAEKLEGVLTTDSGWVISYGSRVYRPPIIRGDVKRTGPMTISEIAYAQSLTRRPVKGMLTGPVTIIAWSYVNPYLPIERIAYELARALNDEVRDYLAAGIRIVQIDEPAFRERAPVKKRDWPAYFDWAVKAFRVAAQSSPEAQIHTHMCYSAFNEIIGEIDKLDADVISIEAARSEGRIVEAFESIGYARGIGIGVWDIHSPQAPDKERMRSVIARALEKLPRENVWINPDCGLKTRKWEEIGEPLAAIPELARELREEHKNP
ncbi:MAG: 5-methyltetrahydropteroyltriglutamate--homocysteine S-methyltransferase [Spirochaetales bacterium]|nr:5-methyltetrahydropteroyltriglutamate--homocysteine S-methyltransferase [Spirochaetales bacterium]